MIKIVSGKFNWVAIDCISSEEKIYFHCPITQDIITSPPLLLIGVNGTPIHIFEGSALLESFKHNGLMNPITREKINLTQIKYGDEAILLNNLSNKINSLQVIHQAKWRLKVEAWGSIKEIIR